MVKEGEKVVYRRDHGDSTRLPHSPRTATAEQMSAAQPVAEGDAEGSRSPWGASAGAAPEDGVLRRDPPLEQGKSARRKEQRR